MIPEQDKERIEREANNHATLNYAKAPKQEDKEAIYVQMVSVCSFTAGATAENLRYEKVVDALEKIANPVKYLQDKAKEEGFHLNGQMAIQLSNDPGWLRQAATDALNQLNAPLKDSI